MSLFTLVLFFILLDLKTDKQMNQKGILFARGQSSVARLLGVIGAEAPNLVPQKLIIPLKIQKRLFFKFN